MTTTQTNQDRITEALARINADGFKLATERVEMNNGVVSWGMYTVDGKSVTLNLTRSDADMADLLDVIAVLTEGEARS